MSPQMGQFFSKSEELSLVFKKQKGHYPINARYAAENI